jgi:hypothetical protein
MHRQDRRQVIERRTLLGNQRTSSKSYGATRLPAAGPPPNLWMAAARAGRADYLPLWAGQSAALGGRRPADTTFAALVAETEQLLRSPMLALANVK